MDAIILLTTFLIIVLNIFFTCYVISLDNVPSIYEKNIFKKIIRRSVLIMQVAINTINKKKNFAVLRSEFVAFFIIIFLSMLQTNLYVRSLEDNIVSVIPYFLIMSLFVCVIGVTYLVVSKKSIYDFEEFTKFNLIGTIFVAIVIVIIEKIMPDISWVGNITSLLLFITVAFLLNRLTYLLKDLNTLQTEFVRYLYCLSYLQLLGVYAFSKIKSIVILDDIRIEAYALALIVFIISYYRSKIIIKLERRIQNKQTTDLIYIVIIAIFWVRILC